MFWEKTRDLNGKSLSPHRPSENRPGRSLRPVLEGPQIVLDEALSQQNIASPDILIQHKRKGKNAEIYHDINTFVRSNNQSEIDEHIDTTRF